MNFLATPELFFFFIISTWC